MEEGTTVTEAEWLACTDPEKMMMFLWKSEKITDRKRRLFGVAVCRRIWHYLTDERSRTAVEVAARHADGQATAKELDAAYLAAFDVADALTESKDVDRNALRHAAWTADLASHPQWIGGGVALEAAEAVGTEIENVAQADLVRCLCGNPFHPLTLDPIWLTPGVVGIAAFIYDDRAFGHLPILADALEETGCTNKDILQHCRQHSEHDRGCWVVDILLGKK
jgi:hypothetical protein